MSNFMRGTMDNLQYLGTNAKQLHRQRQEIHDVSYRNFKTQIRREVLNL